MDGFDNTVDTNPSHAARPTAYRFSHSVTGLLAHPVEPTQLGVGKAAGLGLQDEWFFVGYGFGFQP